MSWLCGIRNHAVTRTSLLCPNQTTSLSRNFKCCFDCACSWVCERSTERSEQGVGTGTTQRETSSLKATAFCTDAEWSCEQVDGHASLALKKPYSFLPVVVFGCYVNLLRDSHGDFVPWSISNTLPSVTLAFLKQIQKIMTYPIISQK